MDSRIRGNDKGGRTQGSAPTQTPLRGVLDAGSSPVWQGAVHEPPLHKRADTQVRPYGRNRVRPSNNGFPHSRE